MQDTLPPVFISVERPIWRDRRTRHSLQRHTCTGIGKGHTQQYTQAHYSSTEGGRGGQIALSRSPDHVVPCDSGRQPRLEGESTAAVAASAAVVETAAARAAGSGENQGPGCCCPERSIWPQRIPRGRSAVVCAVVYICCDWHLESDRWVGK